MVGFNFAPVNWAFCDGSRLPISQYDALYSLIGTTYGGNGQTTFNLPDLRGRVPIHNGGSYVLGQNGGSETVPLTPNQLGAHGHTLMASGNNASSPTAAGNVWAVTSNTQYTDKAANTKMSPSAMTNSGMGLPHENMIPFTAINFIIALYGIWPSQG